MAKRFSFGKKGFDAGMTGLTDAEHVKAAAEIRRGMAASEIDQLEWEKTQAQKYGETDLTVYEERQAIWRKRAADQHWLLTGEERED